MDEKFLTIVSLIKEDEVDIFEDEIDLKVVTNVITGKFNSKGRKSFFDLLSVSKFKEYLTNGKADEVYNQGLCSNDNTLDLATFYNHVENYGIITQFPVNPDQYYSIINKIANPFQIGKYLKNNNITDITISVAKEGIIFKLLNSEVSIREAFKNHYEEFKILLNWHAVPLYQDAIRFNFSSIETEINSLLINFAPVFFRNFIYDNAVNNFKNIYDNTITFENYINKIIENLFRSRLNSRFSKKDDISNYRFLFNQLFANFLQKLALGEVKIKCEHTNGYIDEILKLGENVSKSSLYDLEYFNKYLKSIYNIDDISLTMLHFFTACTQKVKLSGGDPRFNRVMMLIGDSGVGKDTIIASMISGKRLSDNKNVFRGGLVGVTGFSSLTEHDYRAMYMNVISDNLDSANKDILLDRISSLNITVEEKGKTTKRIKKTFNTLITNNLQRILFSKDNDNNAIARRFLYCNIEYKEGWNIEKYQQLMNGFYDTKSAEFFFASYYYTIYKNITTDKEKMMKLQDECTFNMRRKVRDFIYLNDTDYRIIDCICNSYRQGVGIIEEDDFIFIESVEKLIIPSSLHVSNKYIRKTLELINKDIKFRLTKRINGVIKYIFCEIPKKVFFNEIMQYADIKGDKEVEKLIEKVERNYDVNELPY